MSSLLQSVAVVLVTPLNPINIGATVRAMANMGLSQLRLVNPVEYDASRIESIAHGTRDLVRAIRHFDSAEAALADCVRVHAYAGKPRAARWQRHDPRSSAAELLEFAEQGPVAIVFGPEDHGLENDALDRAHATVTIPTTATHMSLNLAQAVLVASYELHLAAGDATRRLPKPRADTPPASQDHYERTFEVFRRALDACDFFKTRNPELVMRTVRSLAFRAAPSTREVDLARAMAIEVLRTIDRVQGIYRGGYGKRDTPPVE